MSDTTAAPVGPSKLRSALIAIPFAIVLEIICILLNVGGLVSLLVAYLISFLVVHQVRARR